MKRTLVLWCLLVVSAVVHSQNTIQEIIDIKECAGYAPEGEPELFVGDDLFGLINGGAELYHEFGFVEVIAAGISREGSLIKTEVYDMGSPQAAWGIYSLTSTTNAKQIEAGEAARSGEGFAQMIKGHYMVYVYSESNDMEGMLGVLQCVEGEIAETGSKPMLLKAMEEYSGGNGSPSYFHGNLGLSPVYNFHYKDVFAYSEGAALKQKDHISIVLSYPDAQRCGEKFSASYEFFENSKKYHEQTWADSRYSMRDRKEKMLDFYRNDNYMIIVIHDGTLDSEKEMTRLLEFTGTHE